jgi:hypothetical protein
MAHMVKITSVIHDMVHGKMNVMVLNMYVPMKHICDTQQANKGEERGTIILGHSLLSK